MPDALWTIGLYALLGVTLLAIAVIDARRLLIPDALALLVALLAAVATLRDILDPIDALLGASTGFATLALLRSWWQWRRGVEGVGVGDLKLIVGLGAWTGLEGVFVALGIAGVLGLIVEAGIRGRRAGDRLPLGSYLCIAIAATLLLAGTR